MSQHRITRNGVSTEGGSDSDTAADGGNGDADTELCAYTFDPATATDSSIQTTWECPHQTYQDSTRCLFHMSADERSSRRITPEEITAAIRENLSRDDPHANEYIGATLPRLPLTYQDINGATNHTINFQRAEIGGIDLTHGRLNQGLNLCEATVDEFTVRDAELFGVIEAHGAEFGAFNATEAVFHQDLRLTDARFRDEAIFDEAVFEEDTTFDDCRFEKVAQFRNIQSSGSSHILGDHLSFAGVRFRGDTGFRQANFEYVVFEDVQFESESDFNHATFDGHAIFESAMFDRAAQFCDAVFEEDATFEDATFNARAEFQGVRFTGGSRTSSDDVTFEGAAFRSDADFKLAQFRYSDFEGAAFAGQANFDRAVFTAPAEFLGTEFGETVTLHRAEFTDPAKFSESTFNGPVNAIEVEFNSDADFDACTFAAEARFGEARFREDASFQDCEFAEQALFRGAVFEGEAKHLEKNASFVGATFAAGADFEAADFTNISFRDTTFAGTCSFVEATFSDSVEFRIRSGDADIYVDLTDAEICGGEITHLTGQSVPYDLTSATLGDVSLISEGDDYDLLNHFRFCLTEFDHFDFGNHHSSLERNDWVIHDFEGMMQ